MCYPHEIKTIIIIIIAFFFFILLLGRLRSLTSTPVPILSPVTDNCPSWISRRVRMTVEKISWIILINEWWQTVVLNLQPPDYQSDIHLTELLGPEKWNEARDILHWKWTHPKCKVDGLTNVWTLQVYLLPSSHFLLCSFFRQLGTRPCYRVRMWLMRHKPWWRKNSQNFQNYNNTTSLLDILLHHTVYCVNKDSD